MALPLYSADIASIAFDIMERTCVLCALWLCSPHCALGSDGRWRASAATTARRSHGLRENHSDCATCVFYIKGLYISRLHGTTHPGVEKLEVMLVNTDLVSNSQRKTKFIWCARKIRTLLGRFARARKFLDRGTPGLRSKFESQSARMPNIRKASPECSKAQSLLHFKAKFSFQHPISHLFHTSTGPLSPGLRLFLRLLSRSRFRPSRGRAGVSLGLDGWL